MTITTYNTFVNNLASLSIKGVKRAFAGPPAGVETSDLPCSFPRAVSAAEGPFTTQTAGAWPEFTAELVIIVEPVAQDSSPLNHAKVIDLMDAVATAIRAVPTNTLGKGPLSWTIELRSSEIVGERPYWGLNVSVTGYG